MDQQAKFPVYIIEKNEGIWAPWKGVIRLDANGTKVTLLLRGNEHYPVTRCEISQVDSLDDALAFYEENENFCPGTVGDFDALRLPMVQRLRDLECIGDSHDE